ncbi:glutathione transferase GstA [Noviherbaspirillum cavernae]|uniref:Glutathione transferase GstA n=1 Tax=Noviherbaspirillum cavernae TaxID=2320862 RepID=A0A418WXA8_9BURK|nr:glutathione transferase GstA [Noviherbaspirillum cavernae]RJG04753.1 glutathione transferase GstA [Noviherbaspirillum cavernae]
MKLFIAPGACSLSPHIVLREAGFPFDMEKVTLADKKTAGGADFRAINPKGYVPALVLDSGDVLTEGPAIVQYLADQVPEKKLVPAAGTMERYRLIEWLNYISTELHKGFSPLFKPGTPDETKKMARDTLALRLEIIAAQLQGKDYLTGSDFTVADAYLFTVLNWAARVDVDLSRWPVFKTYRERVAARPAVRAAMVAEGLIKE